MRTLGKRKGAVLIVVLGVLAVLALLATTFATLQATEKQVARNYLDTVRAKMLAQSGVSDAEARLREFFPFQYFNTVNPAAPRPWKFWGTDNTEQKDPDPKIKLEESTNPSFAIEDEAIQNPTDANVKPKQITIEGKQRGLSGVFGTGTYATHGDHYALKISDISGRLYVNDGIDGGANGSVSQNLKRILNVLGDVLQIPQLGDKILASRPTTGYRSPQDLLKALGYDDALFERIKNHVTVYAWVDPNVVNPVPLSDKLVANYPVKYYRGNPPVYRLQRSATSFKDDDAYDSSSFELITNSSKASENKMACLYGLDCLNPQWVEVVSRAPVNVNSASREVLVALLTDLKGFFVSDRRRNNPRWKGDLYLSFKQQNSFSSAGNEGDEIGYLMETIPVVGPGGTATNGISAFDIADELISCRNRQAGKFANYSSEPFGGPFRNWAQFYAFIDALTATQTNPTNLISDNRPGLHVDYEEETDDPAGFSLKLVESDVQREHASRAIADAIKANFNPNCHLNELNPDENLYLRVDKTDLIVNSTEFTFMPTGYFEIESLGRIVRPKDPNATEAYAGDNDLVAQAKVTATYRLYDLYRETNQKQFAGGTLPGRTGASNTNNDMSLEIGPEPDNGRFPGMFGDPRDADNEFDGYVSFATVGGDGHSSAPKAKNTLVTTDQRSGSAQYGAAMHVHFQYDHDAHHSLLDPKEIASRDLGDEKVENHASIVGNARLSYKRPYGPASGPVINQTPIHRLAKSFRQTMNSSSGTVTAPTLGFFAPSDLRIDGAYSERHSAPCYYAYKGTQALLPLFGPGANGATNKAQGTISFWWKPSFYPNLTGKVRAPFDFSRYHEACGQNVNTWPWAIWFYPSHYDPAVSEGVHPRADTGAPVYGPQYWHNNQGQFEPSSLCWGSKAWHDVSSGHSFGTMTKSLNHLDHVKRNPACATKPNLLVAHKWMNTTATFKLDGNDADGSRSSLMYINGNRSMGGAVPSPLTNSPHNFYTMTTWSAGWSIMDKWDKHDGGDSNQIRLGAPSKISDAAEAQSSSTEKKVKGAYKGNYTGDHTVDEFYLWSTFDTEPLTLWQQGRYYKPLNTSYGEGIFVSQALSFVGANPRVAAPPTSIPTPGGTGGAPTSVPVIAPQIRVLGLSWTWQAEGIHQTTGAQALYDYNTTLGIAATDVKPRLLAGIRDGSVSYGPFDNDAFSAVRAPDGTIPVIQDPKQLKYFAQFKLESANLSSILLASPVLDDVTIYWDDSRTHLLSYVFDNRSF